MIAPVFPCFLRGTRVPTVMGFDPLFQFMHEADVAEAICCALDARLRGVFNVSGPPPIPLSLIIRRCGRTRIPVPEALFRFALGQTGLHRECRLGQVQGRFVIGHFSPGSSI